MLGRGLAFEGLRRHRPRRLTRRPQPPRRPPRHHAVTGASSGSGRRAAALPALRSRMLAVVPELRVEPGVNRGDDGGILAPVDDLGTTIDLAVLD